MRIPILFVLLALALAEIAVFIIVGGAIGVLPTLLLVLLGLVAGALLLRWTGIATIARIRTELAAKRLPGRPLFDGAVMAVTAMLFILPGFISDVVGLLLLAPPVRNAVWRRLSARARMTGDFRTFSSRRPPVVELDRADYERRPEASSPWRQSGDDRT